MNHAFTYLFTKLSTKYCTNPDNKLTFLSWISTAKSLLILQKFIMERQKNQKQGYQCHLPNKND